MRVTGIVLRLVRPTSLVRFGFVIVSAGIVSNAVLLQGGGHHPAPLFETRHDNAVTAATDSVAPERDNLVFEIQDALRRSELYGGPLDGIAGPRTTEAIKAYERAHGRTPTGVVSLELLAELTNQPDTASADAPQADAPSAPRPLPDARLQAVQSALARAAYGPLPADGLFGPQTRDAISRFQRDHGLQPTGDFDEALVTELRAAGALE